MSDSHQQQQGRDGGEKYDKHPNRNNGNWMQKNSPNGNDGFKGGRGPGRKRGRRGNRGSRRGHPNTRNPNLNPSPPQDQRNCHSNEGNYPENPRQSSNSSPGEGGQNFQGPRPGPSSRGHRRNRGKSCSPILHGDPMQSHQDRGGSQNRPDGHYHQSAPQRLHSQRNQSGPSRGVRNSHGGSFSPPEGRGHHRRRQSPIHQSLPRGVQSHRKPNRPPSMPSQDVRNDSNYFAFQGAVNDQGSSNRSRPDSGDPPDFHESPDERRYFARDGHHFQDSPPDPRFRESSSSRGVLNQQGQNWNLERRSHPDARNPNPSPPQDHQNYQYRNMSPRRLQEDRDSYPGSPNYSPPSSGEARNYRRSGSPPRQPHDPEFRGFSPGEEHFHREFSSGPHQDRGGSQSWPLARRSQSPPQESQNHQNWNRPSMEYSSQGNYNSNYDNDYHEPPRRRSNSPYDQGGRHGQYGSRESSSQYRQGSRSPPREQIMPITQFRDTHSPQQYQHQRRSVSRSPSPPRHRQRSPDWSDDEYPNRPQTSSIQDHRDFDFYQSSSNRDPESRSPPRGVQNYDERNQFPYRSSDNWESNSRGCGQGDYDSDYDNYQEQGRSSGGNPYGPRTDSQSCSSSRGVQNQQRSRTQSREQETTQNLEPQMRFRNAPTPPSQVHSHPPRDCGTPNSWESTSRSPSPRQRSPSLKPSYSNDDQWLRRRFENLEVPSDSRRLSEFHDDDSYYSYGNHREETRPGKQESPCEDFESTENQDPEWNRDENFEDGDRPARKWNFPNPKASWLKWLEEQDNREDSEDDMEETIEEIRKALEEARPLPRPVFRPRRATGGVFHQRVVVQQTRVREKTMEEWKSEMEMQSSETWKATLRPTISDPTFHWLRYQDPPCSLISKLTRKIVDVEYTNPRVKNRCIYCDGRHFNDECPVIVDVQARRAHLVKNGHCVRCLRRHRPHTNCNRPDDFKCDYCDDMNPSGGLHHRSICPNAHVPTETPVVEEEGGNVKTWPDL